MVPSPIRRLLNNRIAQNAAALYAVQLFSTLLPLVSIPILTRILGPESMGFLGFGQSFANWLAVVGEYGFNYSATRSIARQRDNANAVAGIVMSIIGAKLLLVLGMFLVTVVGLLAIPIFREQNALAFWALGIAVAAALNPLWYFQAIERAWFMAVLEFVARILHLLGIILFVRDPQDAWVALAAQAVTALFTASIGLYLMYREVPFKMPTLPLSVVALRVSWSLFLARAADSFYVSANGMILGLLSVPAQIGFFSSAERLVRPGLSFLFPLAQAIYPRINNLMKRDEQAATRLSWLALLATTGLGFAGGMMLFLVAPWVVPWLLGDQFHDSVPVVQVLSLLLPIVGFGFSLSMQYMFPRRMDREVTFSVLIAASVNVVLAILLAPRMGAMGMAIAVVSAEASAALTRFVILKLRRVL
ncbi:MAG: oligosaccharide flippase family protein [Meiothermus sp.]|nr:oligosaccharide flippase family protein [Meiothermus sp.]